MASVVTPRLSQLADQLMQDISVRELNPGDRYMTTAEASKFLSVGNGAANRALQLLERRGVITRQQRRGAYIADWQANPSPQLCRVHFLVHRHYLRSEGVGQDEVLLGIEHELPGVPVQISFLPQGNESAFVRELLDESQRMKRTDGFILVRASYETQRLLNDRQVPAVADGTVFPCLERLASLSLNMQQTGEILTTYLLERGHRRIAYFNRQITYRGDQQTMDGIVRTMQAAGLGLDALIMRFLPSYAEVTAAETRQLLHQQTPPTGFICRTAQQAEAVAQVAVEERCDVDVTVCQYYLKPGETPRFPWARSTVSSEKHGRKLARILVKQTEVPPAEAGHQPQREILPVELEIPGQAGGPRALSRPRGRNGNTSEN